MYIENFTSQNIELVNEVDTMKEFITYSKQPINKDGVPYNLNFQELRAYFKN